jgi:hypothetical protein
MYVLSSLPGNTNRILLLGGDQAGLSGVRFSSASAVQNITLWRLCDRLLIGPGMIGRSSGFGGSSCGPFLPKQGHRVRQEPGCIRSAIRVSIGQCSLSLSTLKLRPISLPNTGKLADKRARKVCIPGCYRPPPSLPRSDSKRVGGVVATPRQQKNWTCLMGDN